MYFKDEAGLQTSIAESEGVSQFHREDNQAAREDINELIQNEAKAVACWRAVVFFCLASAGAIVSTLVYQYVQTDKQKEFESSFEANALRIVESVESIAEERLAAVSTISTTITSFALDTNATFPFVTLPRFAERGCDIRVLSGSFVLHYFPLILDDDIRSQWEEYALERRFHIDEAYESDLKYRTSEDLRYFDILPEVDGDGNIVDPDVADDNSSTNFEIADSEYNGTIESLPFVLEDGTGYHPRIHTIWKPSPDEPKPTEAAPPNSGPYLPRWHVSPITYLRQSRLNVDFDKAPIFKGILQIIQRDMTAVLGHAIIVTPVGQVNLKANLKISQFRQSTDTYSDDPLTYMGYPVFESFDEDNKQLAGVVATNLYWRQFFTQILPSDAIGYICVIRNSFNQTLSYRIDGSDVTFLGFEDLHDDQYDDMVVSVNINAYVEEKANPETRAYNTVPYNTEYGVYELHVYPSADTEGEFDFMLATYYTAFVAGIFVVTLLSFFLFDKLVTRRQRILMERATKSSALVASLFPKQVHDRLFSPSDEKKTSVLTWAQDSNSVEETTFVQNHSHDAPEESPQDNINDTGHTVMKRKTKGTQRIADLFPECTILFTDIAGFTQWSASRLPDDVFELLETLYEAFDRLARKHQVFKVETIGDCYLAATGLPEAQPEHAVIMVKFARDCLMKASQIIASLEESLGEGTRDLQLRVGLHSGPVTAGILRGQKSRFQIFGDTVNTASRMESTGSPGKIHISEKTAIELTLVGKAAWVKHREDQVYAKGKGLLQTFWIALEKMDRRGQNSVHTSSDSRD